MTLIRKSDSTSTITLDALPQGAVLLTGDRPTGPLHLGHYVGSLRSRVRLQENYTQYVLIADVQALTDNFSNPQKVRDNVLEVMLDYLAVGIDPSKTTIYLASAIPETAELTLYFCNLVNMGRLQRNPTVKSELKRKNFGEGVPVGFVLYPINQAADIAQLCAKVVPVGEDQIPMIEQTNDIVGRFRELYGDGILTECRALLGSGGLLPGTDGQLKMGKSLGNAIYLSDSEKEVARKVKGMFTDPNHLRVEDPGKVEGNPVFSYLDEFDRDKESLEELKRHYERGGIGDGVVKQRLIGVLHEFLEPIRKRRLEYGADKGEVLSILARGTFRTREQVALTMSKVRQVMGIYQL
jgi:tryptophanyl-tRNA synthetase